MRDVTKIFFGWNDIKFKNEYLKSWKEIRQDGRENKFFFPLSLVSIFIIWTQTKRYDIM